MFLYPKSFFSSFFVLNLFCGETIPYLCWWWGGGGGGGENFNVPDVAIAKVVIPVLN